MDLKTIAVLTGLTLEQVIELIAGNGVNAQSKYLKNEVANNINNVMITKMLFDHKSNKSAEIRAYADSTKTSKKSKNTANSFDGGSYSKTKKDTCEDWKSKMTIEDFQYIMTHRNTVKNKIMAKKTNDFLKLLKKDNIQYIFMDKDLEKKIQESLVKSISQVQREFIIANEGTPIITGRVVAIDPYIKLFSGYDHNFRFNSDIVYQFKAMNPYKLAKMLKKNKDLNTADKRALDQLLSQKFNTLNDDSQIYNLLTSDLNNDALVSKVEYDNIADSLRKDNLDEVVIGVLAYHDGNKKVKGEVVPMFFKLHTYLAIIKDIKTIGRELTYLEKRILDMYNKGKLRN